MSRIRFAIATVLLATLTACGGDDDDTNNGNPSPSPDETTAVASPAPTEGAPASAGTLSSANFSPAVSFDVPAGWEVVEDTPAVMLIKHVEGVPPEEQAWVGVFKVSDVRNPENFGEAQPIPEDITAWLVANRHLIVDSGPTPVTLDGIAGSQIDIRTRLNYEPALFGLAGRPADDNFGMAFLDAARIIELQDVDGGTIIISANADEQAYFADVLPLVEPVIASVDFE